eukprot:CAMPEP_0117656626 /NCGR_PEP_ID=MMETSP0804-20121206/4903_2 /TAXON_ID=1074897 /ORGANISM="Tetraselmis astigmatica, Strain CCMP880" /LENGTH=274 /DNA_ID=CAMNT_0005463037 /DNA_START=321 /DNA_END=1146 /DNA_ORIENTATION=-
MANEGSVELLLRFGLASPSPVVFLSPHRDKASHESPLRAEIHVGPSMAFLKPPSMVGVDLPQLGQVPAVCLVQSGAVPLLVFGFEAEPRVALDKLKLVKPWQHLAHELLDLLGAEAVGVMSFGLPIGHRKLGDPDGLVVQLVDFVEPTEELLRDGLAVPMDSHEVHTVAIGVAAFHEDFIQSLSAWAAAGLPSVSPSIASNSGQCSRASSTVMLAWSAPSGSLNAKTWRHIPSRCIFLIPSSRSETFAFPPHTMGTNSTSSICGDLAGTSGAQL